ncbi:hypothetical protein GCM10009663_24230 [Kitasatospora arboriphila]|uniref:Uncharacterized protein n=1 Tax=Kitasatospora arboriphila TaxID=258052 RepID=A0ABN1TFH9_9ACTN
MEYSRTKVATPAANRARLARRKARSPGRRRRSAAAAGAASAAEGDDGVRAPGSVAADAPVLAGDMART